MLLGYLAGLAFQISQPPVPAQNQQLAARHLRTGLSGYWESNVVTLTSGDRVRIRAVAPSGGRLAPRLRVSDAQWYDAARNTANRVVHFPGVAGYPGFTPQQAALVTFGPPGRAYHVGGYTILAWNKNLLADLAR